MESILELMIKQRNERFQQNDFRRAELQKITGDKFKAEIIVELLPESQTVYEAVRDSLLRGFDTEYIITILTRHKTK